MEAEKLDRLIGLLERLLPKLEAYERMLPDPDSMAGKALARRLRKTGADPQTAAAMFGQRER